MRPGQAAPDEVGGDQVTQGIAGASMRPGQAAPDEAPMPSLRDWVSMKRFNEAGASSPG